MPPLDTARIAIIRMSAIGDVVHTLPLAASIRAAAPDAHITWLIQPGPHELIRQHPAIDEFILFDRQSPFRSLKALRQTLRDRRFDLVLVPQTSAKAALAARHFRAPRKVGFDRARAPELSWVVTNERIAGRPRAHVQDEVLEFVDHLGIPRVLSWDIGPTAEERERYGPLLPPFDGPTVAIALASSRRDKDWPAEMWARLARRLIRIHGARLILVGGLSAAENEAAQLAAQADFASLDLRAWDLRRLAYLAGEADLFVGGDSGPLHIASAIGTPTVALMGSTNPKRFAPYRHRDLVIDAFGDPGEVYSAAAPPRPGRMERITVEMVEERILLALSSAATPAEGEPPASR